MLLTELQAREKWCPLSRAIDWLGDGDKHTSTNRHGDGSPHEACKCLASDCMMFRFGAPIMEYAGSTQTEHPGGEGWKFASFHNYQTGNVDRRWGRETAKRGYCGLAGKVEAA